MGSLHPAIVHIPIGLLFIYSLLEIFVCLFPRFKPTFSSAKYWMLVIGVFGSFAAFQSGEGAEDLHEGMQALIDMHENIATATIWAYVIPAVFLTIQQLKKSVLVQSLTKKHAFFAMSWNMKLKLAGFFTNRVVLFVFAVTGAVLLSFTGALGGAISHGPKADFFVEWVYTLFF